MVFIKKQSRLEQCVIKGEVRKEWERVIYTLTLPPQQIIFDVANSQLVDEGIKVDVTLHGENPEVRNGRWSQQDFDQFVQGVKRAAAEAFPFIKGDLELTAEAAIRDDILFRTQADKEFVRTGIIKGETRIFQCVSFEILGLKSPFIRWEPELLNCVLELKSAFNEQREAFRQEMLRVKAEDSESTEAT
jgi:hypothetical protein